MSLENGNPIIETFHQPNLNFEDILTEATHPELENFNSKIGSEESETQPMEYNGQNKKYLEISDNSLVSNIQTYSVKDNFSAVTLPSTRKENSDQYYEESSVLQEPLDSLNSNISSNVEPSIDEICSFEYIKNLIVKGPKLSDIAASDIYGQLNIMSNEELETDERSAVYDKYISNLEALDQQLYNKIEQTLATASLEFKIRRSLSEMDDPTGDDLTDINVRAERYTAEFMERFAKYKSEQGNSDV